MNDVSVFYAMLCIDNHPSFIYIFYYDLRTLPPSTQYTQNAFAWEKNFKEQKNIHFISTDIGDQHFPNLKSTSNVTV